MNFRARHEWTLDLNEYLFGGGVGYSLHWPSDTFLFCSKPVYVLKVVHLYQLVEQDADLIFKHGSLTQYLTVRWHDYRIPTYLIRALWVRATYLFTNSVIRSCDSLDWSIQTCYWSASSRVTETFFWPGHVGHVSKYILLQKILLLYR